MPIKQINRKLSNWKQCMQCKQTGPYETNNHKLNCPAYAARYNKPAWLWNIDTTQQLIETNSTSPSIISNDFRLPLQCFHEQELDLNYFLKMTPKESWNLNILFFVYITNIPEILNRITNNFWTYILTKALSLIPASPNPIHTRVIALELLRNVYLGQ